jgi:hypothetical protein
MEFIKKYITFVFIFLLLISGIIILKQYFSHKNGVSNTIIKNDTTLLIRYEKEIRKDTVIKWYDKFLYKKSEPEIIYYQKTDTVFLEKVNTFDLMIEVKKKDNKLLIKAVNPEGKTLKEYIYENVFDNFSIVSQKNNIFVKSAKFRWNGISALLNVQYPLFDKMKKPDYQPGIETGIIYRNKFGLSATLNYSFLNKQVFINTNLKIKF